MYQMEHIWRKVSLLLYFIYDDDTYSFYVRRYLLGLDVYYP